MVALSSIGCERWFMSLIRGRDGLVQDRGGCGHDDGRLGDPAHPSDLARHLALLLQATVRNCDILHAHGKSVFFHSDGHIESIFPDLVEIGVDAVNSQLFCMDIEKLGERFPGQ